MAIVGSTNAQTRTRKRGIAVSQPANEIRPQPGPQEDFLASPATIVVYGGRAGCGKTYAEVLDPLRWTHLGADFHCRGFRRTMPEVRQAGGLWDTSRKLYPLFGAHGREQTCEWTFPSGATVKFDHLQHEHTKFNHDGGSYAVILMDELIYFTESQFWYIIRSNRTVCGIQPYVRCTTNPKDGSWVKELLSWWIGPDDYPIEERSGVLRYVIRSDSGELIWNDEPFTLEVDGEPSEAISFTFIPGKLEDNPALLEADPQYKSRLATLPPEERRRLRDGWWGSAGSNTAQIFQEFDPKRHFLTEQQADYLEREHVRKGHLRLYEGYDFGTGALSATSVVWSFYDESLDRLYPWRWVCGYEKPVSWLANTVRRVRRELGLPVYEQVADPAGMQRDSEQRNWYDRLEEISKAWRGDQPIILKPSVNRPVETIWVHRWALRHNKICCHPELATRKPYGPLRPGNVREKKSVADMYREYKYKLDDDYDPARDGDKPGVSQPLKNWASHPADSLGYIVREIWAHVAEGMKAL